MLHVDKDIIFGRLYYHFEEKYSYQKPNEAWVNFFLIEFDGDKHVINFPLLSSVLSGLKEENKKHKWAIRFGVIAIGISLCTLGFNIGLKLAAPSQPKPQAVIPLEKQEPNPKKPT
ncbi:MAG: hypothetical protein GY931_20940 [Maribacter sp.]|nr:hypothetical protein [Maribacter sp.]